MIWQEAIPLLALFPSKSVISTRRLIAALYPSGERRHLDSAAQKLGPLCQLTASAMRTALRTPRGLGPYWISCIPLGTACFTLPEGDNGGHPHIPLVSLKTPDLHAKGQFLLYVVFLNHGGNVPGPKSSITQATPNERDVSGPRPWMYWSIS